MAQTNQIDPGQFMQIDRRVRQPGSRDAGSEMDMVARVEEVLYQSKTTFLSKLEKKWSRMGIVEKGGRERGVSREGRTTCVPDPS